MALPVEQSLAPMLGRLVRELPLGPYRYEPKWDGFRCLAFRDGGAVELRSRHGRPLARYFPEVVRALRVLGEPRLVLDGEIVLLDRAFDFAALMRRLHPAGSLVERLAREQPATLVAFDLLAAGDDDLTARPLGERRAALERLLAAPPPGLLLTPQTADAAVARDWLARFAGGGLDGVIAKRDDSGYEPGVRAMLKVKHERTADCVLAGCRLVAGRPAVSSLLLGLYDAEGALVHVGVAANFAAARRLELAREVAPLAVPLEEHPWRGGYLLGGGATGRLRGAAGRWDPAEMPLDWVPLAPVRVCEVAYEQVDGPRFRHPARFRRWRPDRDPRSCGVDQLETAPPPLLEALAAAGGR